MWERCNNDRELYKTLSLQEADICSVDQDLHKAHLKGNTKVTKSIEMKTPILTLALTALTTATILSSCTSAADQVKIEQENVITANEKLTDAENEYYAEIAEYKKANLEKIAANEKSIAEFKARIASDKKDAKDDYNERIAELDKQNSDLKKKMDEYEESGKENWAEFKKEFNHDMEELGKAFNDFTHKNTTK